MKEIENLQIIEAQTGKNSVQALFYKQLIMKKQRK